MARLLIVEDERNLAEGLKFNLELEGHEVRVLGAAEEALDGYTAYDMLILDIMLPGMSGLEFLERIRKEDKRFPVLILSAKIREEDRLNGLSAGADDYVTKPFSLPELMIRVQRMLERRNWYAASTDQQDRIDFGNAWIDFRTFNAQTVEGERRLTAYECFVMKYLAEHADRPVSRGELLEKVWGVTSTMETRTVDTFIVRLRKLFEPDPRNPVHILTVRGVGYQFHL